MTLLNASLLQRAWRKVDVKLSINGTLHMLRWRRGMLLDEVLFDDKRVAVSRGLFGRESLFGLDVETAPGDRTRLVFVIDAEPDWNDWNGDMAPRGVRLESADAALIAFGSLAPRGNDPFRVLYDRAIKALGLNA